MANAKKSSRKIRSDWQELRDQVVECQKCPRLIQHCQKIAKEKRKAYRDWEYWGRPVPNLVPIGGDRRRRIPLLIVGLAPGAHGANRTGRMFTGDRSGEWLFRAMKKAGFTNQAESNSLTDGLLVKKCVVTNACRCAPPDNKPTSSEVANCQPFFQRTIEICRPKVFLALGGLAWKTVVKYAENVSWLDRPSPKFGHGHFASLKNNTFLLGSYHPSQQNTFTGRLTKKMLDNVFLAAKRLIESKP